jgi:hypothetical protein
VWTVLWLLTGEKEKRVVEGSELKESGKEQLAVDTIGMEGKI